MPPSLTSPRFLLSALFIAVHIAARTYSLDQNGLFVSYCAGKISVNASNNYDPNLRGFFTGLIASASSSPSLYSFLNSTTPPQINGLAQCRPDLSPAACAACLNDPTIFYRISMNNCGPNGSGVILSGNCLVRYSAKAFDSAFALENQGISYQDNKAQNVSASFTRQLQVLMKNVTAAAAGADLRFAVGMAKVSEDDLDIYGMGWCSMDFVSSGCEKCFDLVSAKIPAGKNRGVAGSVNCQVRFETYQFYGSPTNKTAPVTAAAGGGQETDRAKKFIIIGATFAAVALLLIFFLLVMLLRRRNKKLTPSFEIEHAENEMIVDDETFMFDFDTLREATDDFSKENKLGQGGFGSVYKGILKSGQEIAVKRLSRTSKQGLSEMKNEIHFIARLQHKNLVKLLGYCLEGDEKLLVYEYLPNGSLDKLLFGDVKCMNWKTRLKIIEGIGRGLLYMHEDSHFRVIHRDLKASNILLDDNMDPKISDFGLAKLFSADETHKNTRRIAGTYGYMAPEYALRGRFSTKSDVFSYGVLVLELISGRKNSSFIETNLESGLPNYIWRCWNEGMGLKVIDQSLGDEYQPQEVLRNIQIGLLCVQEDQAQRPGMALLALMHSTSSIALPPPCKPAFCRQSSTANGVLASINDMTISAMEAR